jgi:TonB family protein
MRRGLSLRLLAWALLALSVPASATPPAIGPPDPVHPFTQEEWKGSCGERGGCAASRDWGNSTIYIRFEAASPGQPWAHGASIDYTLMRPCDGRTLELSGSLAVPLAEESDVAAHLGTAIESAQGNCARPPLDPATAASVTQLVRHFTLVGGTRVPDYSATKPAPFDSMWNYHPINPDVWIDEVADYPDSAKRSRQGGAVESELTIRSDSGHVIMCTVLGSSGVAELDATTCRLLLRRARFVPGAGPTGISRYVIRTMWDISKIEVPYCTGLRCKVGPDGRPVKADQFIFK